MLIRKLLRIPILLLLSAVESGSMREGTKSAVNQAAQWLLGEASPAQRKPATALLEEFRQDSHSLTHKLYESVRGIRDQFRCGSRPIEEVELRNEEA